MKELTKEEFIKLLNEEYYRMCVEEYNIKIFKTDSPGLLKVVIDNFVSIFVRCDNLLEFFENDKAYFYYLSKMD